MENGFQGRQLKRITPSFDAQDFPQLKLLTIWIRIVWGLGRKTESPGFHRFFPPGQLGSHSDIGVMIIRGIVGRLYKAYLRKTFGSYHSYPASQGFALNRGFDEYNFSLEYFILEEEMKIEISIDYYGDKRNKEIPIRWTGMRPEPRNVDAG